MRRLYALFATATLLLFAGCTWTPVECRNLVSGVTVKGTRGPVSGRIHYRDPNGFDQYIDYWNSEWWKCR